LDATISIWKSNLELVSKNWDTKLKISDQAREEILQFATDHYNELSGSGAQWNGRQIRNAFQTAIALAEYQAQQIRKEYEIEGVLPPCLRKAHFETVAKASKHFDQYLEETVGSTATLAAEAHERRDDLDGNGISLDALKK